jgi:hypothetical protein
LLNFIYFRLIFEPAHFIMERKMLLGIKERAEIATASGYDLLADSATVRTGRIQINQRAEKVHVNRAP